MFTIRGDLRSISLLGWQTVVLVAHDLTGVSFESAEFANSFNPEPQEAAGKVVWGDGLLVWCVWCSSSEAVRHLKPPMAAMVARR